MSESFVSREEFNSLKQEVQALKTEIDENKKLLVAIDKKIDVITELTLKPLNKRVSDLEESHKWLQRTVGATLIGIAIKILFEVAKNVNI